MVTDQISFKSDKLIFYEIKYIKDLNTSNSLYLVFNNLDAYIEKSGENKYLICALTEKNKIVLKDYTELWDEIKEQIELITGDKVNRYSNDFMKIRFESEDSLSLGKTLNVPVCVIIIRGVFEEDSKYYPQILLHASFYEYEENINPLVVESVNQYMRNDFILLSDKSYYSNPLVM